MCQFPSWIEHNGTNLFLTDEDFPIGKTTNWFDFVGHHAIRDVFNLSETQGTNQELWSKPVPKKFIDAIKKGKCTRMMEKNGIVIITFSKTGRISSYESNCAGNSIKYKALDDNGNGIYTLSNALLLHKSRLVDMREVLVVSVNKNRAILVDRTIRSVNSVKHIINPRITEEDNFSPISLEWNSKSRSQVLQTTHLPHNVDFATILFDEAEHKYHEKLILYYKWQDNRRKIYVIESKSNTEPLDYKERCYTQLGKEDKFTVLDADGVVVTELS